LAIAAVPDGSQIKRSSERIDDRNTLDLATVGHIFGIQLAAAKLLRDLADDGCPVRDERIRA
jgi:hypothetical protein